MTVGGMGFIPERLLMMMMMMILLSTAQFDNNINSVRESMNVYIMNKNTISLGSCKILADTLTLLSESLQLLP